MSSLPSPHQLVANVSSHRGALLVGSSPLNFIPKVLWEVRGRRILDVGCGCGIYGYMLRNKWQDTFPGSEQFSDFANRDQNNDEPEFLAGVDTQTESVRRCRKHRIYDFLALARAEKLPFPANFVDTVLCIEVLEHLPKAVALTALTRFEEIARLRIVITVPKQAVDPISGRDERGFLKIDTDDPDVREWIEAETHKSAFTIPDLQALGFRVGRDLGRGWKRPFRFGLRLWELYGPYSGQILAVKDLHKAPAHVLDHGVAEPSTWTEGIPDYRSL